MKPTNEQLNQAVAVALGWTNIHEKANTPSGIDAYGTVPLPHTIVNRGPWGTWRHYIPRFCEDRNLLPQLWAKVKDATVKRQDKMFTENVGELFMIALEELTDSEEIRDHWQWDLAGIMAEPRLHVIAFLCALDLYPEDWEKG